MNDDSPTAAEPSRPTPPSRFGFELIAADGVARAGTLTTPHGVVETPVFMPVGTQATVKGLTPDMVAAAGAGIILGNTYHLALRPGPELIAALGGLHRFMNWPGAILTDSGGFQVYSLAHQRKITDHGATFRSHIDGRPLELTPESAVRIQERLGSDIAMCLDECPPAQAPADVMAQAVRRSIDWAERCRAARTRPDQALFAIVQGGLDVDLRRRCAEPMVAMDFPGYALGGFSVGEAPDQMHAALPASAALLPWEKPRYLMGVGRPIDLLVGVAAGIDMFDCVLPTRNGRNAHALTHAGVVKLKNARHATDPGPLDPDCGCYTCRNFSRAYLHHLFDAQEMLGPTLVSLHNIAYYLDLMRQAREAIRAGRYAGYVQSCMARWAGDA
jgi:queuine tRNA-ribosyltransferase